MYPVSVFDSKKCEPDGWSVRSCVAAIRGLDCLGELIYGPVAPAYPHEAAHDAADHVLQEGVGGDLELKKRAILEPGGRKNGALRRAAFGRPSGEAAEVALTEQAARRVSHCAHVQVVGYHQATPVPAASRNLAPPEHIAVPAAASSAAGIEAGSRIASLDGPD